MKISYTPVPGEDPALCPPCVATLAETVTVRPNPFSQHPAEVREWTLILTQGGAQVELDIASAHQAMHGIIDRMRDLQERGLDVSLL